MAAPGGAAARAAVGAVAGGGAVRPAGAAGERPQENGGGAASVIKNVLRVFLLTQAVQLGIKYLTTPKGGTAPAAEVSSHAGGDGATAAAAAASNTVAVKAPQPGIVPLWPQGTEFDVHFFVSGPDGRPDVVNPELPHYTVSGIKLGEWKWEHDWNTEIVLPKSVQNNGTLYLDTFLARDGSPLLPQQAGFSPENVYHYRKPLMFFQKLKRVRAVKSLLGSDGEQDVESEEEAKAKDQAMPIIAYYHPNITMNIIANSDPTPITQLVPVLQQYHTTVPPAPGSRNPRYYPIVYPNTFWQLREAAFPINSTVSAVPLNVHFAPLSLMKFNLYASMDESFRQAANNPAMGGAGVAEFDEVKRVFLETNPLLLILTGIVTALHSLFEFLAFKNDVSHWKNRKDQTGVSLGTIVTNIIVQLIITLYLLDNNSETSIMIVAGQGIGLLIEAWKITKAVDIKLVKSNGVLPYKVQIKDKHVLSKEEEATKVYDKLAFKWVIWGTTPFLIGYTVYSLLYEEHRGWYSFVITTLTQFTYMFGFIQLIPQLIINWKLKSVAHMPMKSLTYKALNTVIDDIFSFVIRMPTLHRLACFRDDVVFVILLYQYWIYPVDKSRANEYGQTLEDKEPEKSDAKKENLKAVAVKETKKNQ